MTFLCFATFTCWNNDILKLLPLETITFNDATLSDINVVLCYVLSQCWYRHEKNVQADRCVLTPGEECRNHTEPVCSNTTITGRPSLFSRRQLKKSVFISLVYVRQRFHLNKTLIAEHQHRAQKWHHQIKASSRFRCLVFQSGSGCKIYYRWRSLFERGLNHVCK